MNVVRQLRERIGVTQAELADLAGTSQPTIAAYEAGRKSPTLRTLERLAESAGLELHPTLVAPLTREERRSLELHRAIARRLLEQPEPALRVARRNLARMVGANPGASPLLRRWRQELSRPTEELADLLIDPRPAARELRHVTPFAGVLTPHERWGVYRRLQGEEVQGEP